MSCPSAIEPSLRRSKRERHKSVLEIQHTVGDALAFLALMGQTGQTHCVVHPARKNLTLWQNHDGVHLIRPLVLDQAVLLGAIWLVLDHVAQGSWVSLTSEDLFGLGQALEQV